jgi:hypothetical protein
LAVPAQIVPKPGTANPGRRNENTALAQLVTGSNLTMGRLFHRILNYRLLDGRIDPVLQVRCPPVLLEQDIDSIGLHRLLVAIERIPRYAHMIRQALETLSSSSARFNSPILCRMTFSVLCNMRVTSSWF